jgi:hypothetical protein
MPHYDNSVELCPTSSHGQQVLRNNNAMGERQQPTNSGLLATHLLAQAIATVGLPTIQALRRPEALGEAA